MLLITCPYCGPREEGEFSCGGEAHIRRPAADVRLRDGEFAQYLFLRDNPKGPFTERWCHDAGCRRWFNVVRDTLTHRILETYEMGFLPESPEGRAAYRGNWRRRSKAEAAAKPMSRRRVRRLGAAGGKAKAKAKAGARNSARAGAGAKTKAGVKAKAGTSASAKVKTTVKVKTKSKVAVKPKAKSAAKSAAKSVVKSTAKTAAKASVKTKSGTGANTRKKTGAGSARAGRGS